ALVLDQSGPNILPEEGFMQVLQRFQLENAWTLTVPRIGGFDFDPATIQVSAYVALGAPVREVRARARESGESYRLYLLTHTLANDSTIRSYLAVVGCAEERLQVNTTSCVRFWRPCNCDSALLFTQGGTEHALTVAGC